ncbi:Chromosome partition protein Smc [Candidatus Calditenuaceae archaeon HR02]|nr:Chromosome partition protein Smc [Candidatus Calditenuaceae archaeon HR02]
MGSIIGRRSEELEAISQNLRSIMTQLQNIESQISGSVISQIKSAAQEMIARFDALASTQPEYLIKEFIEGVNVLKSLTSYLVIFQEQQEELARLLEFQREQVEVLEKARQAILQERERLEQEKNNLETLRQELIQLRQEVEEKDRALRNFEKEVEELEERKAYLEEKIRELHGSYFAALQSAAEGIEKTMKELDKRFKVREARLERLVRLEERKREEILRLEAAKSIAEEYNKQFSQLAEEVRRLEKKKAQLAQEISRLESEKRELERIKQELRGGILRGPT